MILDYLKNVGITLSGMLISMFLVTLLNYFNIIGAYFLSVLEIIISIAWIFTGGFLIGRKAKSKGLLGIRVKFEAKSLIFYLILITSSMIGAIIGIGKNLTKD